MLNSTPMPAYALQHDFKNLIPGRSIQMGEILFRKIEQSREANAESISSLSPLKSVSEDPNQPIVSRIDFRVGKITKVWQHEKAERLFCEEIDVGESSARTVASALRGFYSEEDLLGRLVIVVCNLKEAKLQGFLSNGMVLAAKSSDGKVELVDPPSESSVGDRVYCDGVGGSPWPSTKVKKEKAWDAVVVDLKTNMHGHVVWRDTILRTSKGECFVRTLKNAPVS